MKKTLALILALVMVLALCACGAKEEAPAAPAGETVTVTFSTGETYEATAGEDFVFFFQCNSPGDMGAPAEGEEGAGITVSEGTVTYSNVGLGGPFSYPTSEKVTISGFTGDITVTVTDAAVAQGATYTIYTDPAEIEEAIAYAEEMAAQMAANPMGASDEASGEPAAEGESSGEPSAEQLSASQDFEITVDGVTGVAHYEDTDNGDQATKSYVIVFDGNEITGTIDKGVWTADDPANQAVVDAVKTAFEGGNVVGPAA